VFGVITVITGVFLARVDTVTMPITNISMKENKIAALKSGYFLRRYEKV